MTQVHEYKYDCEIKDELTLVPIEFVFAVNDIFAGNGCPTKATVARTTSYYPNYYDHVSLIIKGNPGDYDTMLAWDTVDGKPVNKKIFLGHWNDGVVSE